MAESLGFRGTLSVLTIMLALASMQGVVAAQDPPPPPNQKVDDPQKDPPKPAEATKAESPISVSIVSPDVSVAGRNLTMHFVAVNNSKVPVENVILHAFLDANLRIDATANRRVQISVGILHAGESRSVRVDVVADGAGKARVRAGVVVGPDLANQIEVVLQVQEGPPTLPIAPPSAQQPPAGGIPLAQPDPFQIDPKTPLEKLLPIPPKNQAKLVLIDKLDQVPEMAFEEPLAKNIQPQQAVTLLGQRIAAIRHLNKTKSDAYMIALVQRRPDLVGLPFVMGEACRQKEDQARHFTIARNQVTQSMAQNISVPIGEADQAPAIGASAFWDNFQSNCQQLDRAQRDDAKIHTMPARVAALMQVCGPQSAHMRKGLVRYLAGLSHVDATKALAKLAIYSQEDDIRQAAIDALKIRRERDYTDILRQGLRYPLPAVAKRTAEAIVALGRTDLIPELVNLLDEPDPRSPTLQKIDKKEVTVVRELVKINHHKNCLLCHAPGDRSQNPQIPQAPIQSPRTSVKSTQRQPAIEFVSFQAPEPARQPTPPPLAAEPPQVPDVAPGDIVTGGIPIPGMPLPSVSNGYNNSVADMFVRVDVTYLRQDFSLMLPVADHGVWPEMQRFDFLVRHRRLTDQEAQAFRQTLHKAGGSPYHQVAHQALCQLTGQNAEPTSAAWRRVLSSQQ